MEISEVSREDLSALADLYQQLVPNTPAIEKMEDVLSSNKDNPNHIVLVAKDNDKLIGTLFASCCNMLFGECKSFMVVEDVVVDKGFRRRGVGEQLMRKIESYAFDNNCSYIMLITDSDRPESQKFYKSLG